MIKGKSARGLALQIKLITDHNYGYTSDFIVNIEKMFPPTKISSTPVIHIIYQ